MTIEEAIEVIRNLQINIGRRNGKHLIQEAMNMAIEALERKGEWIYHTEPLAFRPYGHYTCNLCNEISWDKSNFCPNCGADMRGNDD